MSQSPRTFASNATPPAPPTFVPTPIGPPPGPPTAVPTATPAGSAPAATSTPAATPVPTVKPTVILDFSLDAARVAQLHNPGNLKGLASVKPGTAVELMMYYTLRSLPKSATRVTTYEILSGHKTVYKVAYRGKESKSDIGRFSRYALYTVPSTLPYGTYLYRATLSIGSHSQSASWKFQVGRSTREAASR